MSAATTITSVSEMLVEATDLAETAERHRHVRCWFRGQRKADWKLHPKLYRVGPADEHDHR